MKTASYTEATVLRSGATKPLLLPLVFIAGLASMTALGAVHRNPRVLWSFLGACGVLCAWNAALLLWSRGRERTLTVEIFPKRQHYLQACAQGSVFLYWGWYWPPVYAFAPFILAQLVFAYAFDMLLGWSRRNQYTLGFAQFPVVFSTNLFLWFKPAWFYLQFVMIAGGLAAQ